MDKIINYKALSLIKSFWKCILRDNFHWLTWVGMIQATWLLSHVTEAYGSKTETIWELKNLTLSQKRVKKHSCSLCLTHEPVGSKATVGRFWFWHICLRLMCSVHLVSHVPDPSNHPYKPSLAPSSLLKAWQWQIRLWTYKLERSFGKLNHPDVKTPTNRKRNTVTPELWFKWTENGADNKKIHQRFQ